MQYNPFHNQLVKDGFPVFTPKSPYSGSEVHHAPAPHTIAGGLFLGDRMFFNKPYLASIEAEGGFFLVKAKGNLNPTIRRAYTSEGREIKRYHNQPLATLKPKMARYKALDLDEEWEGELKARLVVAWNAKENKLRYLVTNLARGAYPRRGLHRLSAVLANRAHVQGVEELRQSACLRYLQGKHRQGFIWAALCASLLKRYWAHLTQRLCGLPISTRKVAMCLHYVLANIFRAILHCPP